MLWMNARPRDVARAQSRVAQDASDNKEWSGRMREWCLSFAAPLLAMLAWMCPFDWVCCTSPLIIIITLLLQQQEKIASLSSYRNEVQSSGNFLLQLTSRQAMQLLWGGQKAASPCDIYTYMYICMCDNVCICMNVHMYVPVAQ